MACCGGGGFIGGRFSENETEKKGKELIQTIVKRKKEKRPSKQKNTHIFGNQKEDTAIEKTDTPEWRPYLSTRKEEGGETGKVEEQGASAPYDWFKKKERTGVLGKAA